MPVLKVSDLIERLQLLGQPDAEVHLVVDGTEQMEYRPLERVVLGTYSDRPIAWFLGEDIPDSLADQLAEPGP